MKKWIFGVLLGLVVVLGWSDYGYPDWVSSPIYTQWPNQIPEPGWYPYFYNAIDIDLNVDGSNSIVYTDQFSENIILQLVASDNRSIADGYYRQYFRNGKMYYSDRLEFTINFFINGRLFPKAYEYLNENAQLHHQISPNLGGYEAFFNGLPMFNSSDYHETSDPNGLRFLMNPHYYANPYKININNTIWTTQNFDSNSAREYSKIDMIDYSSTDYCLFKKDYVITEGNSFDISLDYYNCMSVIPYQENFEDTLPTSNFKLKIPDNSHNWTFQIEKDTTSPIIQNFESNVTNGEMVLSNYSNWYNTTSNFFFNVIDRGAGFTYFSNEGSYRGTYEFIIYRFIKPNGEYYYFPENSWFPNIPINYSSLLHHYYYKIFQELGVDKIQFYPNNSYQPRTWNAYQNKTWIQSPTPGNDPNINLQQGPNKLILYATDVVSNLSTTEYTIGYDITPPDPVDESKIYFEFLTQPAAPELGTSADQIRNLDGVNLSWQSVQDMAGDYYGVGTEKYQIDYSNENYKTIYTPEDRNALNAIFNIDYYPTKMWTPNLLDSPKPLSDEIITTELENWSYFSYGYQFLFNSNQLISDFKVIVNTHDSEKIILPEDISVGYNRYYSTYSESEPCINPEISVLQNDVNPLEYEIIFKLPTKDFSEICFWVYDIPIYLKSCKFSYDNEFNVYGKKDIPTTLQQNFYLAEMNETLNHTPGTETYSFFITPIDYLGKENENATEKQITTPPLADNFTIDPVIFNNSETYDIVDGNIQYSGKLTIINENSIDFTFDDTGIDMLKGINIYCYDPEGNPLGVHKVNDELIIFDANQNQITIDFTLQNNKDDPENIVNFAHRKLQFFPVVVVKKTDDPSVADDPENWLEIKGTETYLAEVPNFSDYTLYLFENDGGTFQENPVFYNTPDGNEQIIKTNSPLLPSLKNTSVYWLDAESDTLEFSITTQNGMPILPRTPGQSLSKSDIDSFLQQLEIDNNNANTTAAFNNLEEFQLYSSFSETIYCRLNVTEAPDNPAFFHESSYLDFKVTFNDTAQPVRADIITPHDNPADVSPGSDVIMIDDSCYRKLSNETLYPLGKDIFNNSYLYLSDELWNKNPLSIEAMNLNDSMAPVGFNWELASSLDLAAEEFANDWNSASVVNLNEQMTLWNWDLSDPPNQDRNFYIGLRVDIDGQYSYYLMRIFYDATPPTPVTELSYSLTSNENGNPVNKALISWDSAQEEGLRTFVEYTINSETHTVPAEDNAIELDFGSAYNQLVNLNVLTVDKAGNSCLNPPELEFFTSAFPGNLNGTITQRAEREPNGEINRYITIPVTGEKAKTFHLIPGNTELTTEYAPNQNGQIIINGFDPQQEVNFSLRAVNEDDMESDYSLNISRNPLENYPPVIETQLFPVEYAREDEIDFQWDVWDADDDEITTQLYLLQDNTVVEGFPVTTTDNHYFYDAPDLQPLSGEYTWRIEVSDEAHSNAPITETSDLFTIDDQPVIISTTDDLNGYTPREYLHVTIETGISGVDLSATKSYIEILKGGEVLTQQHPFNEDYGIEQEEKQNGNQEVRLSIPLPDEDGEYKIIVHAANKAGRAASEIYSLTFYSGKPIIDTPLISEESHYSDNIYYYCNGYLDMNIQLHDEWGLKSWAYGFMNNPDDEFQAAESFDLATISETTLKDYEPGIIRKKMVMKNNYGIVYLVVKATNIADAVTYSEPVAVFLDPLAPELIASISGPVPFESQFYLANVDNLQIDYDAASSFDPAHNFNSSQDPQYNIDGSGILKAQYSVYQFDKKPVWHDKWEDEVMFDGALDIFKALPDSERPEGDMIYQAAIRVLDKAGNQSLITSPVFALDSTPPENIIIEGLEGTLTGGTLVRITASAEDTHSRIAGYRLKLESADGTVLTNHTPGNIDGWLSDISGEFGFALPKEAISLNDCRFIVQAKNGAGLFSMKNSDLFNLEVADALLINDSGPYFTQTTNLRISWEYNGTLEIASYDYRVLEKDDDSDSVPWTENGNATYALYNQGLVQGQEYVVEVRANYSDTGIAPLTGRSLGVLIDTTAPAFASENGFIAPDTGCHKNNLRIKWNLSEAESGLQSTELLIEKMVKVDMLSGLFTYQRQKATSWIKLPAREQGNQLIQTDAEGNSLDFEDGDRIYLTFRATNKAGLSTEIAWHQIVWDNSTPPVPAVMDQGAIIRAEQARIKGLNFSYIESSDDPHSPTQYTWAYHVEHNVFASQDIKQDFEILEDQTILNQLVWENSPAWCDGSENGLDLQHGDQVFFIVKSKNAAGLESLGISNGITIDSTGPIISSVNITTGGNDGGRHYIKELSSLGVAIDAYTDVFNETITSYDLTFGSLDESYQYVPQSQNYTQSGTGDINEFTNISEFQPENGQTSYFEANALNNAELQSTGLSMGVILDTIKPEVLYVDAKVKNTHVSINSSQIQRYNSKLLFSWDAAFSFAPINTYHCNLFWSNDGSEGSYSEVSSYSAPDPFWTINIDNESDLQDGYYYLRVTAENWALNTSTPKESPKVLIDTNAPVFDAFYAETPDWVDNTYASNEITLVFDAYDEHSGIEEYRFMMGTEMNPNLLTEGWRSCEVVKQENKPPFLLLDFSTLLGGDEAVTQGSHLRMWGQVKDKVGLWSPILQSQIIIIDKTPPDVTSVELPEYSNGTTLVRNINFTFNDSDILGNQYKFNSYIVDSDITLDRFQDYQFPEYFITEQNTIEKQNSVYHKDSADELLNDHEYNCYVEVINRAGVSGQYISTDQVYIDHVKPRFIVDTSFGRFIDNTEYPNMEKHLVFNTISPLDPNYSSENADKSYFNFHYSIDDGLVQEPVEVKFYLDKPGNTFEEFNVSEPTLSDGTLYDWSHWVSDYYMYRIRCTVTDQAGNVGTADDGNYFFLRYNQPPVITFDDMQTTPGAPKKVTIDVTDFDSYSRDENDPGYYTYQWNLGLNTHLLGAPEDMNTRTPTIRFLHSESTASFTDSNLNVRVTDSDGGFIIKTVNIKIHNTYEGDLYYNEIWSDTHELTGDVKVSGWIYGTSENINLTIANNANISIAQGPRGVNTDPLTEGYSLTIGNGNSLTVMPGVVIGPKTDEYFWQGIRLQQGSHTTIIGEDEPANPVLIKQAICGVMVYNGAETRLNNVVFDHNFIGVQTLSTELLIEACDFKNSYYVGIKEDFDPDESNGQPFTKLTDSTFGGYNNQDPNYMDYYDSSETKIELGE